MDDVGIQTLIITIVCSVIGIILAFVATILTVYFGVRSSINEIQKEQKDFHGKLERHDAEFKAFMKIQEEKRTQILLRNQS